MLSGAVLVLAFALSGNIAQAAPPPPEAHGIPGFAENPDPIRTGKAGKAKPLPADPAKKAAVKTLGKVSWPTEGTAEVALPASATTPERTGKASEGPRLAPGKATRPTAAAKTRVGGLPVAVAPVATAKGRSAAPGKVRIHTLGREEAARWGGAAMFTVERADAGTTAAPVQLALDYSAFAEGAGGAYGSRLTLVQLPACAATAAPGEKGCASIPNKITATNDTARRTVRSDVTAAPAGTQAAVYALTATASSAKGDYKATPLSPSASWSVSNSSGGFSWSYPLRMVPTPGDIAPDVTIGYSSQSADGRTGATNNQGSWIGEGFGYEPDYVERSYKSCSEDGHAGSTEQCWAFDNATVMLNGQSSTLVKNDKDGLWHFADDNGAKIEKLDGRTYVTGSDDNDGEYWKITTTDGTEYYFGLNRLPGWTSGKEETKSVWTAPVFGDDVNEPCYNATFSSAHCKQAWRWNLDYVKDRHGNVRSYFYTPETNYYALNAKTDVNGIAYHRAGYVKRIDYGQRDTKVYSTKAPARVVFSVAERCLDDASFDCNPAKFTTANAARWPDTPVDRHCAANTKCTLAQSSQTFWTTKRLTGITTQMSTSAVAGEYADVDAWKFTHFFTDNGDSTKSLWLSKIDHEGRAGGSTAAVPSVEFQGTAMMNRVDSDTDNTDPFYRFRLTTVLSETGSQLDITYAPRECTPGTLPKPGASTKRCYPVVWTPPGKSDPETDWFHKYVVEQITDTDRTGKSDDLVTRYAYHGDAGWRRAEPNGITDPKYLTWSQWQGYGKVSVTGGNGQTMKSRVDYTYLQGLDGDKLPGSTSTRTEKVTDSTGVEYTGHKEFTGFKIEEQAYDLAVGGKVVSKTITQPWKAETATQTASWGTTKATVVRPQSTRVLHRQSDNTWTQTKSVSTYDTTVPGTRLKTTEDLGDTAKSNDEKCTRTSYADVPAQNVYAQVARTETVSVSCGTTPDRTKQVISDQKTTYNAAGDAITSERLTGYDGTTPNYQPTSTTEYDEYGRPTLVKDADLNPTKTAYTDTNGLLTRTTVTNALNHVTVTDHAPAWGVSTGVTDPNKKRTDMQYDALGRLTKVWLADRAKSSTPSIKYSYDVSRDKPVVVKTETLRNDGSYEASYQLYDSLLRLRQTQNPGAGGTSLVSDVWYDGTGKKKKSNATYNAAEQPSGKLITVLDGQIGAQNVYEYDGLGRTTADITLIAGVEQWRTTTTYDGNAVHVDPPVGGVPTTTISDVHGRTTELRHYRTASPQPTGPGIQYDTITYTYTERGLLETVTDSQDNVWRYGYDQLGRKISAEDPDAGTTTFGYDKLDRLEWTRSARGKTLWTTYDALGRETGTWEGEKKTTAKRLTESLYDNTGYLGQPWASVRYIDGVEAYSSYVQVRDALYRPQRTDYYVAAGVSDQLKGTYSFTTSYALDGTVKSTGMPAAGKLPVETFAYTYDELGRPDTMTGSQSTYVKDTLYTGTGQLKGLVMAAGSGRQVQQSFAYEKGTDRLIGSTVDVEGAADPVKATAYAYDQSGNVLSATDTAEPLADVQCFAYDAGQRLTEAWTPAATGDAATGSGTVGSTQSGKRPTACDAAPGASPLGGPSAYWTSYVTDSIGNRQKDVTHDTGLDASKDVTRTFTYGENSSGPHAVTTVTRTAPAGSTTSTYAYDASGNTTSRKTGEAEQAIEWDAEGKPTKITEPDGKVSSFVYDADGNRAVRTDASGTTLYLPGMELKLPAGTGTEVQATRYYSFAGQTVAVRQDNGDLSFLGADHQSTGLVAVAAATGLVTRRRQDPYGNSRGAAPTAWPGEKGFVGGTLDAQSGLTHVGAREYDPSLGKFLSVDPVMDPQDPAQMNAYSYAHNSPITKSDPTGLRPMGPTDSPVTDYYWAKDRGMTTGYYTQKNGEWDWHQTARKDPESQAKYRAYRANPRHYKVYHYDAKVVEKQRADADKRAADRRAAEQAQKREKEGGFFGWMKEMAGNAWDSGKKWVKDHETFLIGVAAGVGCAVALATVVASAACAVIAGAVVGVGAWQYKHPGSTDTDEALGYIGQGSAGAAAGLAQGQLIRGGIQGLMAKRAAQREAQETERIARIVEREAKEKEDKFYENYM
ncbi:RHS repeat-associated core domain-containing protein [Streptomyces roseicoloratus]|uniref:RHS repeat-associated core domain-containing protein n=1 Tax=Streptomyces roseicoloratus TaxID=2508722 RepID=UPI001009B701|nr:RHS repeat-associated core domain-containing protein [Streptomyces roseicoloratus]